MPKAISSTLTRIPPLAFSAVVIAGYLLVIFIDQTLIFPDGKRHVVLFDDAMISMRFALNLVRGKGLVWNAGEFVEGYTNPLWVLIMALAIFLCGKVVAVWAMSFLGIFVAAVNCFLTCKVCERVWSFETGRVSKEFMRQHIWISVLVVGLYFPLGFLSIAGMETGFQAMLFLLFFYFFIGNEFILLQSFLIGLLYLTRPDSLLLVVVIILVAGWRLWSQSYCIPFVAGFFKSQLERLWIVPACLLVMHTLFRYYYYEMLVPNTYVLKVQHIPILYRLANGALYTLYTLFDLWFVILCVAVRCSRGFRKEECQADGGSGLGRINAESSSDSSGYAQLLACDLTGAGGLSWYALGLLVAVTGYQIYVGGDVWLLHRFLAPVIPLAVIVASYGLLIFFDRFGARVSAALTICLLFGSMNCSFISDCSGGTFRGLGEATTLRSEHFRVYWEALELRNLLVKDTATMAVMWAGLIPYYNEFGAIDCLGKVNPQIARSNPRDMDWKLNTQGLLYFPGHNKYDLVKCIKENKPDYVQMSRWGSDDLSDWVASNYVDVRRHGISLLVLPATLPQSSPDYSE